MSSIIGTNPLIDFIICTGLGIATGACVLAQMHAVRIASCWFSPVFVQRVIGLVVFACVACAMFSIAAAIGHTKSIRDPDSILGYALGVVLLAPLIWSDLRSHGRA